MLYTLLKFLGWGALLAFIGACIGWALRSLKCRAEVARAKASTIDVDEVDRMRHRVANLEQVVAERDRLRIQLADVRHADSPGIVGAEPATEPEPAPEPDVQASPEPDVTIVPETDAEAETETETESATAAGFADAAAVEEPAADEPAADEPAADEPAADEPAAEEPSADEPAAEEPSVDAPASDDAAEMAALDVDAASAVIGVKVELDDLTVVEGIGPKISELCSGIGISTWRQLADADVADLQSMLDAAGSRYTVHKPGTWPRQAELLATGQWTEFKTLTDELDGGK